MSTNNYGLNQWESTDRIMMEDFNEDNAKIDAALKAEQEAREAAIRELTTAIPKIITGTYIGNNADTRMIDLGFTPKLVFLCCSDGRIYSHSGNTIQILGGLAFDGTPAFTSYNNESQLMVVNNGFQVRYEQFINSSFYLYTNAANITYHYIAIA